LSCSDQLRDRAVDPAQSATRALNKIINGLNKIHMCLNKIDMRLWRLEQDRADGSRTASAPRAALRVFKVSTSPCWHAETDRLQTPLNTQLSGGVTGAVRGPFRVA
jgi:hypothetical protein